MSVIETAYKGYRFRSRLEARYAIYFDCLGLSWVYEHEGYVIEGKPYLPDFWFPHLQCFGEVKPERFTISEYRKAYGLPKPCLLFDDQPGIEGYAITPVANAASVQIDVVDAYQLYIAGKDFPRVDIAASSLRQRIWYLLGETMELDSVIALDHAVIAARSARFEHGEQGSWYDCYFQGTIAMDISELEYDEE